MALLTSEIQRIKFELGYNVLAVGAEPYVGVTQLFEQVIAPYTQGGAATTSATAVPAASAPPPVALTLTDATGFHAGDAVVIGNCVRVSRAMVSATARAGIKSVDEIHFQDTAAGGMSAATKALTRELAYWRDELAGAIGCQNLRNVRRGGGQTIAV